MPELPPRDAKLIRQEGRWTILQFDGTMDQIGEANANRGRDLLEAAVETAIATDPPNLLLDLEGVSFFGSSFIEAMYRAWKRITTAGGEFALASCSSHCTEVLTVTRLGDLWTTYPTRDDATGTLTES